MKTKYKFLLIVLLCGGICSGTYYFHSILHIETVFTHFFYIPIILACFWWGKKGLIVPVFLSLLLITSHLFLKHDMPSIINDYLRVFSFLLIGFIIAILSEHIAKSREISKVTNQQIYARNKQLKERVKELNYFYSMSDIVAKPDISLDEIFQETVNIIPPAWQYSEITCAKIVFNGREFKTDNFKETKWRQTAPIKMQKKEVGTCEVYYLKEKPELDEGPFSKEERSLINTITERLGRIAERKTLEEELREYKTAIEQSADGIALTDMEGNIRLVNESWAKMHGYSVDEIVGRHLSIFHTREQMENEVIPSNKLLLAEGSNRVEIGHARKGGATFPTEMITTVVRRENGEPFGLLAICRDITERKQTEEKLNRLNVELERSNRDLQEFTYTISHDLQEPLRKITAFGEFLVEDCGKELPEKGRQHIQHMQDAAIRMKERIQHLLSIARIETQGKEFVTVDTHQVIDKVLDDLSEQIKECKAEITVDKNLPAVKADPIQLSRVFQNLISNAMKFRLPDRSPHISISGQVENKQAVFSVTDNGIGIEQQFFEKIFGVFRRLHQQEEYEGAGVGLAVCKKIIRRHGGKIWVRSEPGKGSTFIFTLSAAQKNKGEIHE